MLLVCRSVLGAGSLAHWQTGGLAFITTHSLAAAPVTAGQGARRKQSAVPLLRCCCCLRPPLGLTMLLLLFLPRSCGRCRPQQVAATAPEQPPPPQRHGCAHTTAVTVAKPRQAGQGKGMNQQSPSPSSSSQQHAQQIPQYAAGPDLATHFDDPFLSDFQLALVTPEKVELARFNVHGIVLAGQSGYFKSLLQNWMGAEARVFSITITDDELPAAKHMLQCAYSNSMPPDADAQQLLATMILADR